MYQVSYQGTLSGVPQELQNECAFRRSGQSLRVSHAAGKLDSRPAESAPCRQPVNRRHNAGAQSKGEE